MHISMKKLKCLIILVNLYYIQTYFRQSSIFSDGYNILYGNTQPHPLTPWVRTGVFHHWLTWRSFLSLLRSSLSGSVVSDASTYKNKPVEISHIFCKHNKIQSKTPLIISNYVLQNGDMIFSSTCNMQNWTTHSWSTDMIGTCTD